MANQNHKKYSGWIASAALGELRPEREIALRAHLAECQACRAEYEQAREVSALVDRGVSRIVSSEPSPQFAASLRARLAAQPADEPVSGVFSRAAYRARAAWIPAAVGVFALAALLLVVVSPGPRRAAGALESVWQHQSTSGHDFSRAVSDAKSTRLQPLRARMASSHTASEAPVRAAKRPSAVILSEAKNLSSLQAANKRNPSSIRRHAQTSEPEVLVPPGQLEAILLFEDAVRSGQIDPKKLAAEQQDLQKPISIKPIEIKPIEIPPLDVNNLPSLSLPPNPARLRFAP